LTGPDTVVKYRNLLKSCQLYSTLCKTVDPTSELPLPHPTKGLGIGLPLTVSFCEKFAFGGRRAGLET